MIFQNSSHRSPRVAVPARSSRLCIATLLAILSAFLLPSAFGAQMRFGPYTNYDGTLLTNFQIIVQPVGDPAVDAAGNAAAMNGLPLRLTIGADGMLTNRMQNQNFRVLNAPPTPNFFTANGYMFRAPKDSGPTIYSTTQPGVFITGMNYFVTLVMSNGTVASVTYNVVTNALGYAPLQPSDTNGYLRALQGTNISTFISGVYSNSLFTDYTTKLAQLSALSITNAFATNAAGVIQANGRIYISTNYDALGAALAAFQAGSNYTVTVSNGLQAQIVGGATTLAQVTNVNNAGGGVIGTNGISLTYKFSTAGTNAIIAMVAPLTNGFVDKSITNNAATIAFAISLTNGLAGGGITATTATNIAAFQAALATNALAISSGLAAFAPTNQFDVTGAAAIKANTNKPTIFSGTFFGGTNYGNALWPNSSLPAGATMISSNQINVQSMAADSIGANTTNYLTLASSLRFDFDNGEFDDSSGHVIIDHSGLYHGSLALASNLPAAGLSTNGSASLQIPVSIGGVTVWTNVSTALGSTVGTSNVTAFVYTNALPGLTNPFVVALQGNARLLTVSNLIVVGPLRVSSTNVLGLFPVIQDYLSGDILFLNHASTTASFGHTNAAGASGFLTQHMDSSYSFFNVASTIPNLANIAYTWYLYTNGDTTQPFYAQLTTNGFWATNFFGNGSGLINTMSTNLQGAALAQVTNIVGALSAGATIAITNAYGTNLPTLLFTGQRLYIPTNFDAAGGSNFLYATKMGKTNDFSTGQTGTNIVLEGNIGFGSTGQATNIFGANPTNFVRFLNAGESSVTNGPFIWIPALNLLTNFISGDYITNNGSAFLVKSNTTSLYTSATLFGTYTSVSGVSPIPTAVGTALINSDGFAWTGYLSPTNLAALIAAAAASGGGGGGSGIAITNGTGVMTTLIFTNAAWGLSNTVQTSTARAGMFAIAGISNSVQAPVSGIVGGFGNIVSSGGSHNYIFGGYSNVLSETAFGSIDGGQFNKISVGDFNFIGDGQSNRIFGSVSTHATYNNVLGGFNNTILMPTGGALDFSTILGGSNNTVTASYATAFGSSVTLSNDFTLGASDGTLLNSTTNNQASFYYGNGYRFKGGPAVFDGAVTSGALTMASLANIGTLTNAGPASFNGPVTNFSSSYLRTAMAASGKTNFLFVDSSGKVTTNDFATLAASIAGGGGAGTVSSVDVALAGFTSSGAVTSSGTVTLTRAADLNNLGFGQTNIGFLKVTNTASIGGQVVMSSLILTNGFTNQSLTASTILESDANKKVTSIANGSGALVNNGSGTFSYTPLVDGSALSASQFVATDANTNLVSTQNGRNWTNLVTDPASAHTNLVMQTRGGALIPYDLAALLALGGGGGSQTPWTGPIDAAGYPLLHGTNLPYVINGTNGDTANVAFGEHALKNLPVQTFVGNDNDIGYNTAVGSGALQNALYTNNGTTAHYNTAVGFQALFQCTTGALNTAVGLEALANLTTGTENTAIGNNATLFKLTTGFQNVAVGTSGNGITTHVLNTYCGYGSAPNNDADANQILGALNLSSATAASYNMGVMYNSLTALLTGTQNIGIGRAVGNNYTGSESLNILIGSGSSDVTGESDVVRIGTPGTHTDQYLAGKLHVETSIVITNGISSVTNSAVASASISFPSTTVKWTNTFGINIVLYIDNTAVTGTAIVKNGQQVFSGLANDATLLFKPGDYFSETYTVGSPTARWEPQ